MVEIDYKSASSLFKPASVNAFTSEMKKYIAENPAYKAILDNMDPVLADLQSETDTFLITDAPSVLHRLGVVLAKRAVEKFDSGIYDFTGTRSHCEKL